MDQQRCSNKGGFGGWDGHQQNFAGVKRSGVATFEIGGQFFFLNQDEDKGGKLLKATIRVMQNVQKRGCMLL